ncbi:MAG: hypothetical protein CM1200mP26_06930 [Acidimicrobiales bacterium]|nr:MAG: hypothetical protein CM1200mP26_06930 [Acidimicrobiales bacterium]
MIDGFYQVRGFDTSTVTFIRGDEGWVVIAPPDHHRDCSAAFDLSPNNSVNDR